MKPQTSEQLDRFVNELSALVDRYNLDAIEMLDASLRAAQGCFDVSPAAVAAFRRSMLVRRVT
jgi:hypothetical protein